MTQVLFVHLISNFQKELEMMAKQGFIRTNTKNIRKSFEKTSLELLSDSKMVCGELKITKILILTELRKNEKKIDVFLTKAKLEHMQNAYQKQTHFEMQMQMSFLQSEQTRGVLFLRIKLNT